MTTGTVKSCQSKPTRGFVVHTLIPPPDGTDVPFADVDADDYATALAAYAKGGTVDVSGTSPACTGVVAR